MRKKKGISPLIATVLILGFTVALAAVIMVWGNRFTTTIQKQTEETSTTTLSCATDVDLEIVNVCNDTTSTLTVPFYKITASNNQAGKINRIIMRFYNGTGSGGAFTNSTVFVYSGGISGYGSVVETVVGTGEANYIEAIPVAVINGKEVTCSASIVEYGEMGGPRFEDCA